MGVSISKFCGHSTSHIPTNATVNSRRRPCRTFPGEVTPTRLRVIVANPDGAAWRSTGSMPIRFVHRRLNSLPQQTLPPLRESLFVACNALPLLAKNS